MAKKNTKRLKDDEIEKSKKATSGFLWANSSSLNPYIGIPVTAWVP